MKNNCLLLFVACFICPVVAVRDCYYSDGQIFEPWKANEINENECAWTPFGSSNQKPGSCTNKEVCQLNKGEPVTLNSTNPFQCGSHCCHIALSGCVGNSVAGSNFQRDGSCVLPRYCSNAVATDNTGGCGTNGYGQKLQCCVEQETQIDTVTCSKRFTAAFRRIDRILDVAGDLTPERLTNFMPYIMGTFDELRESCLPRGDCSASTYIAFTYNLLRDFTVEKPEDVYAKMQNALPPTTLSKIEDILFQSGFFDGQMTPEAFGRVVSALWHDKDLNLAHFSAGTCADWVRLGNAVLGEGNSWRCDDRWAKIHSYFTCRPTSETNLVDCSGTAGACYLLSPVASENRCPAVALPGGNSECQQKYGGNAICCKKPSTTSSKMVFDHNEYRNVRVSIDTNITNDPSLIVKIKDQFTKASAMLYEATAQRALFRTVRIILPRTWDPSLANAERTDEKLLNAEFFIKPNVDIDGAKAKATINTVQVGFCGAQGFGTSLTENDLKSKMAAQNIVKHFAFNRYGIFREFPKNEREIQPWQELREKRVQRCVQDNSTAYIYCDEDMELHWSANSQNSEVTGSLAWLPDWAPDGFDTSRVVHFCDGRTCDHKTTHNVNMDNTHNRVCNYYATFDVMLNHNDFNGRGTPSRPGLDTTPEFIIVHEGYQEPTSTSTTSATTATMSTTTYKPDVTPKTQYMVLVLDQSASMEGAPMANLKTAAYQFIDLLDKSIELAIVSFDNVAYEISDFKKCDDNGKIALQNAVNSIRSVGYTCIQSGLLMATELLKDVTKKGGQILLMTDGANNRCGQIGEIFTDDFLSDSIGPITEQGAVAHTVAVTDEADPNLEELADITGGMSFLIANANNIQSFLLTFQSAVVEMTQDDIVKRQILLTSSEKLSPGSERSLAIFLDDGLADDNLITGYYDPSLAPVTGTLVSPIGTLRQEIPCTSVESQNKVSCKLNFKPQPGEWNLKVRSTAAFVPEEKTITISAASIVDTSMQQTFTIEGRMYASKFRVQEDDDFETKWWKKKEETMQVIVVSISYGPMAVLGAEVEAVIESANSLDGGSGPSSYYKQWIVPLADDGKSYENFAKEGVDLYKNDGVYSGIFNLESEALFEGRYSVSIRVRGYEGSTYYLPRVLLGFPKSDNYLARFEHEWTYIPFQRVLQIGSFEVRYGDIAKKSVKTSQNISIKSLFGKLGQRNDIGGEPKIPNLPLVASEKANDDLAYQLPPGRVSELKIASTEIDEDKTTYTFSWIAVGRNGHRVDSGRPNYYSLNATTEPMEAWGRGDELEVAAELDNRKTQSFLLPRRDNDVANRARTGTVTLDKRDWPVGTKVYFSVVAHSLEQGSGLMKWSEPSNMVVAVIPDVEYGSCDADATGSCGNKKSSYNYRG